MRVPGLPLGQAPAIPGTFRELATESVGAANGRPLFYMEFQRKRAAIMAAHTDWSFSRYPTALTFSAVIFCQGMSICSRVPNCSFSQAS